MLLGFLFLSILATKTGVILVLQSILVVLLGPPPNTASVEFSLQDIGKTRFSFCILNNS